MKIVLRALRLGCIPVLLATPGSQAGQPSPCTPRAAHCVERLVVLRPDASAQEADNWLRQQGWTIVRRLDASRLIQVWMPATTEAEARVKRQTWLQLLSDQLYAVPDVGG
jgi:hypothetical protein